MLKLKTVKKYGLNDGIGNEYERHNTCVFVGRKFLTVPWKHNRISGGTSHKNNSSLFHDNNNNSSSFYFMIIKHQLKYNLSDVPKFSMVMNKYNL